MCVASFTNTTTTMATQQCTMRHFRLHIGTLGPTPSLDSGEVRHFLFALLVRAPPNPDNTRVEVPHLQVLEISSISRTLHEWPRRLQPLAVPIGVTTRHTLCTIGGIGFHCILASMDWCQAGLYSFQSCLMPTDTPCIAHSSS